MSLERVLIRVLGLPVGTGANKTFACPFCLERIGSESDKPKLSVNVEKGLAHCWRCEYRTKSAKRLLLDVFGGQIPADAQEAVRELETGRPTVRVGAGVYAQVVMRLTATQSVAKVDSLLPEPLPDKLVAPTRRAIRYAESRGITQETLGLYRVAYCCHGRRSGHLVFPVYMGGVPVYWTTRYAGTPQGDAPKTDNPRLREGYYGKNTVLLNYDNVVGLSEVVLVEGPFSAMSFGRNAVASLGRVLSTAQAGLFRELVRKGLRRVYVCYDAGTGKQADAAAEQLAAVGIKDVRVCHIEEGDPNDTGNRDRLDDILAESLPWAGVSARVRNILSTT